MWLQLKCVWREPLLRARARREPSERGSRAGHATDRRHGDERGRCLRRHGSRVRPLAERRRRRVESHRGLERERALPRRRRVSRVGRHRLDCFAALAGGPPRRDRRRRLQARQYGRSGDARLLAEPRAHRQRIRDAGSLREESHAARLVHVRARFSGPHGNPILAVLADRRCEMRSKPARPFSSWAPRRFSASSAI